MTAREIIHIDMEAFYASVEQRDVPLCNASNEAFLAPSCLSRAFAAPAIASLTWKSIIEGWPRWFVKTSTSPGAGTRV
jgi:hypothetical protein